MTLSVRIFLAVTGSALVLGAPASAQDARTAPDQPAAKRAAKGKDKDAGTVSRDDRRFMETAARDNLTEIHAGKLAQSNASDHRIKQFGQRMERDHSKANVELQKIAAAKGVTLPTTPNKSQQRKLDGLEGKSGADFDKAFVKDAAKDHHKAHELFDKARTDADDPDVRAFAGAMVSAITVHRQMAHDLSRPGPSGKKAARPRPVEDFERTSKR